MSLPIPVPMDMHSFDDCVVSFSDMLNVYHSPAHLFCSFHFSLPALHQLKILSQLQQSPVTSQFPLLDVVNGIDATPNHCAFYFRVLGCLYPLMDPGQILCTRFI